MIQRLLVCVMAFLVAFSARAASSDPVWGPWSPNADPVSYCAAAFTASGAGASGWSNIGPAIFTGDSPPRQVAICQSKCTNQAQCAAQYNVVGTTNGAVTNTRYATCAANATFDVATGMCVTNGCQAKAGVGAGNFELDTGLAWGAPGPDTFYMCVPSEADNCTVEVQVNFGFPAAPWNNATSTTVKTKWVAGSGKYSGQSCTPSTTPDYTGPTTGGTPSTPTAPKPSSSTPCSAGEVAGEANGKTVCYTPAPDEPAMQKKVESKTTTNPDGSTTKTDTTTTATCSGAGSCQTVVSTTVTNTPAGGGASTTTTSSNSSSCTVNQPGCTARGLLGTASGSAGGLGEMDVQHGAVSTGTLPGQPTLYTRKYSQTPGDYFVSKMAAATAPLNGMAGAFFPTWADNYEACPQFSIPVNLGPGWNYGVYQTDIPCSVWTVCRWVIIISALFLARALIFGG